MLIALHVSANTEEVEVNNLRYTIDKEFMTAEVTEFTYVYNEFEYDEDAGNITVPQTIDYDGQTYTVTSIGEYAFNQDRYQTNITAINLPPTVTTIKYRAFSGCYLNKPLILPEGLESIGEEAFRTFGGQRSLTIPSSVKEIGQAAFTNCYLDSVTIACPITAIPDYMFNGSPSLDVVVLPSTVEVIGDVAFGSCNYLHSINLPDNLKTIGKGAFSGCRRRLKSIVIPESVTMIKDGAFTSCESLVSITIPEGITEVRKRTFSGCWALKTVSLPSTLKTIGQGAFKDCLVTDIYCYAQIPPYVDSKAFTYNRNYEGIESTLPKVTTLHVPESAIGNYKSYGYTPWPYCKNIVTVADVEPTPQPEPKKCATPTIAMTEDGIRFDCETEGAECFYKVRADITQDYTAGNTLNIQATSISCTVTVYAKAPGYEDSDSLSKTLTLPISLICQGGGDIDGDGELTISDVTRLIEQYLRIGSNM